MADRLISTPKILFQAPRFFAIKNWKKFQHYKHRNPPWIKLHQEIFTSTDWVMLADASKLLAVVCMVIASRLDGFVPNDPAYIKRVAYLNGDVDLAPLISCGFLIEVLAPASERKQLRTNADPETEYRGRDREENGLPTKKEEVIE